MGKQQRTVLPLIALSLLGSCTDPAEADLDRCIAHEGKKQLREAITACEDAARKDSSSKAGQLALGKLGVLNEKVAARNALEQAEAGAREKQMEREAEARRVKEGGWKYLPRPTGPESRVQYMADVAIAHPGEPVLNRNKAAGLMEKIRKGLAKAAGVPASRIVASVGTASGAIKVADGVLARVGTSEADATDVGVCSEPFLGLAILEVEKEELASAGLRGLMCTSDACSAMFDLRPNRPDGGGVYGGTACISMVEVMEKALGR